MKKIKKLFAVLLALTMVLGMTVTVFAEPSDPSDPGPGGTTATTTQGTGKNTDRGTISVSGIGTGENVKVYAFQIVKANYNGGKENDTFSGYESIYNAITFADSKFTKTGTELAAELAAVQAGFTYNSDGTWSDVNSTDATLEHGYTTMNLEGNAYKATVPVGSYLIVVKNEGTNLYSPIVMSVSYVEGSNGAPLAQEDGSFNIQSDQGWIKVTTDPTVTKTATVPTRTPGDNNADAKSVNIGDTVSYSVEINEVPNYTGSNPVFNVVDTLSTGLNYVLDATTSLPVVTVTTKKGNENATPLTKDTDYLLSINQSGNLVINFVKTEGATNTYLLKAHAGEKLTITYSAKVTDKTALNFDSYNNSAKLNYVKDSTLNATDPGNGGEKESRTYNYTFDLSAVVQGTGNTKTSFLWKSGEVTQDGTPTTAPLNGAEFTLYTDADCSTVYNANNVLGNTDIPNGVVTSKNGGQLTIRGLAAGTYFLKETKAPDGYSLNATVYKIEIKATYYGDMVNGVEVEGTSDDNRGQLKTWSVTLKDKDATDPTATLGGGNFTTQNSVIAGYEIKNTKLASLPSTGGIGTTIFTIGGCALMIIAAGLYFATRRKTAK